MNACYFQWGLLLIIVGMLCFPTSAPSTEKEVHPVCQDNSNSRQDQAGSITNNINSSSHGSDDISVISKKQTMKDVDKISQYSHLQRNKILKMEKVNSIDSIGLQGSYK